MPSERDRAAKAQELAEWFRIIAGEDSRLGELMVRAADALECVAEDEPQDVVPDVIPAVFVSVPRRRPVAANDNAKALRRRTKQ